MKEEVVTIKNKNNVTLRGIVHIPDEKKSSVTPKRGINILVAGIKYRVAPNRLSVKIARELCKKGWFVIRWDPTSIGESEGGLEERKRINEIFIEIQSGLFVDDTIVVTEYFRQKYGLSEVAMLGNCGGAVTALLAENKVNVNRLILIDLPVVFTSITGQGFEKEALRGGKYSDKILKKYLSKIFDLKSWKRFLSFQSNNKVIFRLLLKKIKGLLPSLFTTKEKQLITTGIPEYTDTNEKINKPLFTAFSDFLEKGGKTLFICAENDKSTPILENYFLPFYMNNQTQGNTQESIKKITIADANHIYTTIKSQKDLLSTISNWL